jgi:hypothetical protein
MVGSPIGSLGYGSVALARPTRTCNGSLVPEIFALDRRENMMLLNRVLTQVKTLFNWAVAEDILPPAAES